MPLHLLSIWLITLALLKLAFVMWKENIDVLDHISGSESGSKLRPLLLSY